MMQIKKFSVSQKFNGFLIVNKPAGITSHDVVDRLREITGIRKIGHLGTLDPIGTGVLVLAIGGATKAAKYFMTDDKEYLTTVKLGMTTDTQDTDGKVLSLKENCKITKEEFIGVLEKFRGEIEQIPPMVSAKKIRGKRLYKLHRKGIEVHRDPKKVRIDRIELVEFKPPEATFFVKCSKGTYIRTLCADIGEQTGCGGCMSKLVRMKSGFFDLKNASTLDELGKMNDEEIKQKLIPTKQALLEKGIIL